MKRSKKMIALVAVLAVACIATLVLTQYEEKREEIKNSDAVLLEIPADTVEALSWELAGDGLSFRRDAEGWHCEADAAFPVSEDKINDILSGFEAFGAAFIIENVEDYSQYGLDDPAGTVQLTAAGQNYEIRLGDFSRMDEQRYVDIGDGNVYLVSEDPADLLETELSAMIDHDDVPDFTQAADITFSGSENYTVVRTEDSPHTYDAGDVYFARLDGGELPLDTERVENYLDAVTGLELLDYVTYNATEQELAAYGLDAPELSVTVTPLPAEGEDGAQEAFVFHLGRNREEQQAYEAAREAGDEDLPDVTKYVRIGSSQIVYELEETDYTTLAGAAFDDLRHRRVIWADFASVTQIDVTLEGEEHTVTAAAQEEDVWHYGTGEVDISGLQSALEGLAADSFTDEAPTQKEEIRLTVYLDNENFPQVEIVLYRYDGSLCLAEVDGETVSLVERSAVMELVEAVQAIVLN